MKNYVQKNLEPLLIGFVIAILFIYFTNTITDIIIKINLINND